MKIFIKHLLVFLLIGFLLVIFKTFNIVCPFKFLFKIPCPACGTRRALTSLLRLDFHSYLKYNAMALPLVLCIVLFFHKKLFKNKFSKFVNILLILSIIILTFYYINKLCEI